MKTNRKYKSLLLIVSASLLLGSCSFDDLFDKHSDSAGAATTDGSIAFYPANPATKGGSSDGWQTINVPLGSSDKAPQQATSAVATRGAYSSGTGAPAGSFGVLGYLLKSGDISAVAPSSFMYNTQVTRNGVSGSYTYTYNPKKYWPDNTSDLVSFFAYYPYNGDGITLPASTATGVPKLTYSPSTTVANQVDLMYASTTAVNNKSTGSAVAFNFSHALTRVSFSVKKDVALASKNITVKSIRLSGIKNKGTLIMSDSLVASSLPTDTTSYTCSVTDGTLIPAGSQALSTSSYQLFNTYNGYQLLLPQSVTSATKIYVTYIVDNVTKSVEYNLPQSPIWNKGKSVNYQLTLPSLLDTGTNCYILNPSVSSRSFSLPVSRVNEYWGTSGPGNNASYTIGANDTWKMILIWEDTDKLITLSNFTGTGLATLPIVSVPANVSGNAVVGVMKTSGGVPGPILWSWHLWVTNYNPSLTANTGANTTTYNYNSNLWMDRNLGATTITPLSVSSFGLLYQWGRKDPFPGYSSIGSIIEPTLYPAGTSITKTAVASSLNLENSIQHPLTFYTGSYSWYSVSADIPNNTLWYDNTATKTIYDPCPLGWRIPYFVGSISPWNGLSTGSWYCGYTWTSTPNIGYYPSSGGRDNSSGTLMGNSGTRGFYWSASPDGDCAYYFGLINGDVFPTGFIQRSFGLSVRCVKN